MLDSFANYSKQTGTVCQEPIDVVMACGCVYWLKDAIERSGTDEPVKVSYVLKKTKDFKLINAMVTMDKFRDPKDKDGIIFEGGDGEAVFYKRIKPN